MRKTIGVVVFLISAALVGLAQVDTGSLVGTVKDPSGAVLPGVTVTAASADTSVATSCSMCSRRSGLISVLGLAR